MVDDLGLNIAGSMLLPEVTKTLITSDLLSMCIVLLCSFGIFIIEPQQVHHSHVIIRVAQKIESVTSRGAFSEDGAMPPSSTFVFTF